MKTEREVVSEIRELVGGLATISLTVTAIQQEGQAPEKLYTVSHPDTGMILGSVHSNSMQFGPVEPHVRFFIDTDHALSYLKKLFRDACGREDVDFLISNPETSLIRPAVAMPRRRM